MDHLQKNDRVYIAGHRGMVGSAILRLMRARGFTNLITASHNELNLMDTTEVAEFYEKHKPEYVIMAAARVGGIQANLENPATFLYENLAIQNNLIHQAHVYGSKKIVFLGSSCIYPKESPQPMKEEYLLTGKLEPTNEGYAIAKIAGLKMAEYYFKEHKLPSISLMPCNLYGPNDSFDLQHSHVLSALVRRFVDARNANTNQITLWGSGIARREFMHVDDLAEATMFLLENYDSPEFINVGWGTDVSIKELAAMIAHKTQFGGEIKWDTSKPDGMLRKCMDVSKMLNAGFKPTIDLEQGVDQMIGIYKTLISNN